MVRDPITSLIFSFMATNGASWNVANTLAENIQAIELLDGANVLFSLTGVQAAALEAYRRDSMPTMNITEFPNDPATFIFEYQFGRWQGDLIYALDPSKFSNLQLRVTWNLATIRAVGATGYVTGSMRYTCIANVMEGAPAPQAMLAAKQHYQFITAAAGTTFIDVPTDRRIKAVYVRSAAIAFGGVVGISRLKLTCDQDKFIPLDMLIADVITDMSLSHPPLHYNHSFMFKNNDVIYPLLKWFEDLQLQGYQADDTYVYENYGQGSGTVHVYLAGVADANMRSYIGSVGGWCLYNVLAVDQGEWDDPSTWLDPATFKSIQLQLTNNAAAAVASVVLETELVY
jgi:hypothetical protein